MKYDWNKYKCPSDRCELCKHYKTIDSGYGHCKRFPPQNIRVKWIPLQYEYKYPIVAWCEHACGEYSPKS